MRDQLVQTLRAAILTSLAVAAVAQDAAPGEATLRSAYCIPVVQYQISELHRQAPVEEHASDGDAAKSTAALKHLEELLHLLGVSARSQADKGAFTQAVERGQKDVMHYLQTTSSCATKCASAGKNIDKCQSSCGDAAVVSRMKECENPTWLQH
jgi:hypothetical protein